MCIAGRTRKTCQTWYSASVRLLRLDGGVGGDVELLVVRVLGERVDVKALDEQEPSVADEARRGREPDLVVDLPPLHHRVRPLVQLREQPEAEREIVGQLGLDARELPVFLVHPRLPRELLEDLLSARVRFDPRPGRERQDDGAAPLELFAANDPELEDSE